MVDQGWENIMFARWVVLAEQTLSIITNKIHSTKNLKCNTVQNSIILINSKNQKHQIIKVLTDLIRVALHKLAAFLYSSILQFSIAYNIFMTWAKNSQHVSVVLASEKLYVVSE